MLSADGCCLIELMELKFIVIECLQEVNNGCQSSILYNFAH